jgi:DNA-directed RNA polymerase specialized sigma24 family protein
MRYLDQLSHEEMQHRLKMSSAHVYTTLSRAMSALKTLMKQ